MGKDFSNSVNLSDTSSVINPLSSTKTEDSPNQVLSFLGENFHKLPKYSSLNIGPSITDPIVFTEDVSFTEEIVSGNEITSVESDRMKSYLKITPVIPENAGEKVKSTVTRLIDAILVRSNLIATITKDGAICLKLS